MTVVYLAMLVMLTVGQVLGLATKCFNVCECDTPAILCNLTTTSASIPNFIPLDGFTSLDIRGSPTVSILHANTFPETWGIKELRLSHTDINTKGCTVLDAFRDSLESLSLINSTLTDINGCLLERLALLKTVVIQNNSIKSLKTGIIFDITKVTVLNLGQNEIESISKSAIRSAPLLKTLILGRNRIKALQTGQFEELHALEYLDLSYNYISVLSVDMFRGISGKLTELDISNNRIAASSWPVTLEALKSIPLLTKLNLSGNPLTVLSPHDFNQTLPNLEILDISGCNLRDVPWRFLEGLKELYVVNNQLELVSLDLSAPNIACTGKPCVSIVRDVSRNSIANLSVRKTFTGNNKRGLRILAAGTGLRNFEVFLENTNPDGFTTTRPHLVADITGNHLTKPISIYISHNQNANPQTVDLFLSENKGNNLQFPPLRVFVYPLSNLSLAEEIPTCDLLSKKVDLDILDLSGNGIEKIPPESCIIGQSKILLLNNNMIKTVGRLRLTDPRTEYNRVTEIELRNNIIESISVNAFEGLSKLQKIDLRSNNLVSLPDLSYIATAEFKLLQLDDNRLRCDCDLAWLQSKSEFVDGGKITGRCAYPSSQEGLLFSCFTHETESCGEVKPLADVEEETRQETCQSDNYVDVRNFTVEADQQTRILVRWRKIGPGRVYGYNIVYTSLNSPGKSSIVHPDYTNLTLPGLEPGTHYQVCITVVLYHLVFPYDSGPSYCDNTDTGSLVQQASPVTLGLSISLAIVLLILVLVFVGIAVFFRRYRNVPICSSLSKPDDGQYDEDSPGKRTELSDNYITPEISPDDDMEIYHIPTH